MRAIISGKWNTAKAAICTRARGVFSNFSTKYQSTMSAIIATAIQNLHDIGRGPCCFLSGGCWTGLNTGGDVIPIVLNFHNTIF